jgi:hypothetical protein
MPWLEDKRENAATLIVVGWMLVLGGVLAFFFHPAEAMLGESRFAIIAGLLVAAGLLVNLVGSRIRARQR